MTNHVAILGDTHLDHSPKFIPYFKKFYDNIFFPTLRERGIKNIIQVGDIFDSRRKIDISCLHNSKEFFFSNFEEEFSMHVLVGNHDSYHLNTLNINSPTNLIDSKYQIGIISEPYESEYGLIIPWICQDNEDQIFNTITKSSSKYLFAHLELSGFAMNKGYIMEHGHDAHLFNKFKKVITGHYHTHSEKGNIFYTGTPYQLTFNDVDDTKGFWIMNMDNGDMEFIENPYKMFHKIVYNEGSEYDLSTVENCIVKLIIDSKSDQMKYDIFLKQLQESNPMELKIVENFEQFGDEKIDVDNIDISDTLSLLHKYIESSQFELDKDMLKNTVQTLYNDALLMDTFND
jgi:DNA repair exonuclease SbcCD nuclease subunit